MLQLRWLRTYRPVLYVGKLDGVSLTADNGTQNITAEIKDFTIDVTSKRGSLIWFNANINGEQLPIMLDSGATHNCLALRCVQSSEQLRTLPQLEYKDDPLVGANGQLLSQPEFVIECIVSFGSPQVSVKCKFVVINQLPFSCIIGENILLGFDSWTVSNKNKQLIVNNTTIIPWYHHHEMSSVHHLSLITTSKTNIPPNKSVLINTRVHGSDLLPFRPLSEVTALVESNINISERIGVDILPSVHKFSHQDCSQQIRIHNNSNSTKVIGKGTKVAVCSEFEEYKIDNEFLSNEENHILTVKDTDPIDILCGKIKDLSPTEMTEVRKVLSKYRDLFSVSNDKIGQTDLATFHIDLDSIPVVAVPLRRVPLHHYDIVKQLIAKYLELGLVEKIDSPFRASTVLVSKKNDAESEDVTDRYRLCTDYRQLNKYLKSPGWPSPSLQQCLDATADSSLFSSIDFNSGYLQIPCTNDVKQALAFSPGYGFPQLTWTSMPQGAKPASHAFQRLMDSTFKDHEECVLPPFFDDVVIKGRDFHHHLVNVDKILSDIRKAKLTLNVFKCYFFQKELKYLGHIISNHTIRIDPDRVSTIRNMSCPTDTKMLRSFLGMVQFCSDFCCNLNVVLAPLYDALTKRKLNWSDECQKAFETVKDILCSAPVLYTPSKSDKFVLETDASDIGIGGCLKAYNTSNDLVGIVGYCSKKFSKSELNWHIIEKEGFAVVFGVEHYRHFLIGSEFTIKCDNRVVTYIMEKRELKNKKLLNWALILSEFDFNIIHIASKFNAISDYLSRMHASIVSTISGADIDNELYIEQQKDSTCTSGIEYVNNNKDFNVLRLGDLKQFRKGLNVRNGILCWKGKYVVPKSLRGRVLFFCHDHPTSGHYAVQRTLDRFKERFFWPKALIDVDNWVRSCRKCNSFNTPRPGYTKCELKPIESDQRFQIVCYDLAGPFMPVTVRGNKYVIIIVDHFTHWLELVALRNTEATTLATVLYEEWCCRYGVPERFHSDGAKNVHGNIMKELSRYLGVDKSKSSRLHPEGDGMAEAFVKQTKLCLQKQVDEHGADWDLYLQPTAFAIRSNIAYHTHMSPAELLIGSKLKQPVDFVAPSETKSFTHG